MKHKDGIILAIAIIGMILLLSGLFLYTQRGWFISDSRTEITTGFSPELLNVLDSRYQITIPEDAVFCKGINTNSFRDPRVVILFELPVETDLAADMPDPTDYVFQRLKLDKSRYRFAGHDDETIAQLYKDLGGKLEYMLKDQHESFTCLSYALHEDKLVIRFVGWHPGATFR